MTFSARDQYLETQVTTATPQRLRLMLIEAALRKARAAGDAWKSGRLDDGVAAAAHCRDIVAELIAGIRPDQSELAKQVLGLYLYLFSTLIEAQFHRDELRLRDVIRVLEEARQTWQKVCEQMADQPPALAATSAHEEVAPGRVNDFQAPGVSASMVRPAEAFCLEA